MRIAGYSGIEILAVVAIVLTLTVVVLPNLGNLDQGGKQGVAARNASALNSAAAQYDQSGGLLTAKVTVPSDVKSLPVNALPEMKVLSLLREASGGRLSLLGRSQFSTTAAIGLFGVMTYLQTSWACNPP